MKYKVLVIPLFLLFLVSCTTNNNTDDTVFLKSIEITQEPSKIEYYEGEKFDNTGMEVTAIFSDNSKKIITDYTYEPKEQLTVNNKCVSVTYTYGDFSKSAVQKITVKQHALLEDIYIKQAPSKILYKEGEVFDLTGMTVYAKYTDGTEKEISDYTVLPVDVLSVSDAKVTVIYSENGVTKTTEVSIEVIADSITLTSIEITTAPTKLIYTEGESFNDTGMVVKAYFSDGSKKIVTGYNLSKKDNLTRNEKQIEVSYTVGGITKTAVIEITVKEKIIANFDYDSARGNYGSTYEITGGEYSVTDNVITLSPNGQKIEYVFTGYFNGQIVNNIKNTILSFNNAFVENTSGQPVVISSQKLEISMKKDTVNYIVSSGSSSEKVASIYCYDSNSEKAKNLELGGSGTGYILGLIYHGIKADEVKMKGAGKYFVEATTKGSAINCNTFLIESEKSVTLYLFGSKNGIKADENINVSSGNLYFDSVATCLKTDLVSDDDSDNQKEHFISLSNCNIYHKNIGNLYTTEENGYSEYNVIKNEF